MDAAVDRCFMCFAFVDCLVQWTPGVLRKRVSAESQRAADVALKILAAVAGTALGGRPSALLIRTDGWRFCCCSCLRVGAFGYLAIQ